MVDLFPNEEINESAETKSFCAEVELIENYNPLGNYDLVKELSCEGVSAQQQFWNELPLTTTTTTTTFRNDPTTLDELPRLEESLNIGFDGLNGIVNDDQLQQQQIMDAECNDLQNDPFSSDTTNLYPDQQVVLNEGLQRQIYPYFKMAYPQDVYTKIPGDLMQTFDEYGGHLGHFEETNFYDGINEELLHSKTLPNPIDQDYAFESSNLFQLYQDDSANGAYNDLNQQYNYGVDPYVYYGYPDYLYLDQNDFYNHRDHVYDNLRNYAANNYVGQNTNDDDQKHVQGSLEEGIELKNFQETIETSYPNDIVEISPFSSSHELLTKPNDKPFNTKVERLNISESFDTLTSNYNSSRYSNQEPTNLKGFPSYPPLAVKSSRKSKTNKSKKIKSKSRFSNKQLKECFSESVEGDGSSGFPGDHLCVACRCQFQRPEMLSENESFGQSVSECDTSISTPLNPKIKHIANAENKHKNPFQLKYLVLKTSQDTQGI